LILNDRAFKLISNHKMAKYGLKKLMNVKESRKNKA